MNILLDYFFPITSISPTPEASTAFLKQACVVVSPASMVTTGVITACTSSSAIAALTENLDAVQMLNAGMSKVYILPMDDLDLATALEGHESDFHTLIISSDFTDEDVTADLDIGSFTGVVGLSSDDDAFLATHAAIENRCAFYTSGTNKAKNLCFAFGKMLSNSLNWLNQQYITMPFADDVSTLGDANTYFDDGISFVISDSQYGDRLALFACGGKAIVGPYIKRNLEIDMQSEALSYISGNQPAYSKVQAALLEDELNKVIIEYIGKQWIEAGTVEILLQQSNFVASGNINISEPTAFWRILANMRQTL